MSGEIATLRRAVAELLAMAPAMTVANNKCYFMFMFHVKLTERERERERTALQTKRRRERKA